MILMVFTGSSEGFKEPSRYHQKSYSLVSQSFTHSQDCLLKPKISNLTMRGSRCTIRSFPSASLSHKEGMLVTSQNNSNTSGKAFYVSPHQTYAPLTGQLQKKERVLPFYRSWVPEESCVWTPAKSLGRSSTSVLVPWPLGRVTLIFGCYYIEILKHSTAQCAVQTAPRISGNSVPPAVSVPPPLQSLQVDTVITHLLPSNYQSLSSSTISFMQPITSQLTSLPSRSATPSPNKTAGSRAGRERFAGESYTVLGDQEINGGCHYWEICLLADWKSHSVGVAYRGSLGRFDQLGKSTSSWCLYASQWLQSSLAAKHNNRAKALDWPLPQRIGIYCDYDNGELMFVDVDQFRLLHVFKTKFIQPLVPAFTVWCGGISVATGLQVPSFMGNFVSTNRSLSAD
ncbi:hypothetical protein CRENBAI_025712 [Crenichthys baileyi]|uniref:B30.2/SPRY domain-containing protein n=1 Tax=Crenichthys baileyi TaxID=28760 RepID=A0AAV9SI14_9TELE